MESDQPNKHIAKQFDKELEDLRKKVLQMGGLVEQQLEMALTSLLEGDSEAAEDVIAGDYQVNAMEVGIDEECTEILARRQPVAKDLRFVVAVIKTITDLERIGDEAKNVAKQSLNITRNVARKNQLFELQQLGQYAREMLKQALHAFARQDVDLGFRVVTQDKELDGIYESIIRQQITYMMEDPRSILVAQDVLWSSRALERIGDRCCNICEYVIYQVKGKDIRHISVDQARKKIGH